MAIARDWNRIIPVADETAGARHPRPPNDMGREHGARQMGIFVGFVSTAPPLLTAAFKLPPVALMDSLNDIAGALRAARSMLGMSQNDVAARAKISRQMIARIEKGSKGLTFDAIAKVQRVLEREGVDFFPSTATHGPSIALRKGASEASASDREAATGSGFRE